MLVHNLNPDIISFGNIAIKWYGVFYVIGFAFAIWYFRKFSNLDKEDVYDFFTYLIIGAIGGARLFYVAVYNLSFYLSNPLKIFAVWEGGMSFHGGLLGAFLIGWWFCKRKDISFYYLADLAVIPLALALGLGRIGNFINGELYGTVTNVPWCFKFKGASGCRHPSQLYESLKNFGTALILFFMSRKNFKEGTLFWSFWVLYGFLRFNIEFLRAADPQVGLFFGWLSMGQILSAIMFIVGIVMLYRNNGNVVVKINEKTT